MRPAEQLAAAALYSLVLAVPGTAWTAAAADGCSATVPPPYEALTAVPTLPDPFRTAGGDVVASKAAWGCRRAGIAALVEEYQLGPKPPPPDRLASALDDGRLRIAVGAGDVDVAFDVTILLPEEGPGPYPAMIVMSHPRFGQRPPLDADGAMTGQGVALVFFHNDVLAEQRDAGSRGKGLFYDLHPSHPAGALMAWAWGVSRIIDAFEVTPGARIDPGRIGITGCSRNGKGALVAGAFDERIALTIVQESGAGGTSLWRVADALQQAWIDAGRVPEHGAVQTLAQIVDENAWFRESFRRFASSAERLPFDQHMVMGLVAPRALLVLDNSDYHWLGRESSYLGAVAARETWLALGAADGFAASQRGGHAHCTDVPQAELELVTSFVRAFLVGGPRPAAVPIHTDGGYAADLRNAWIDWSAPTLQ